MLVESSKIYAKLCYCEELYKQESKTSMTIKWLTLCEAAKFLDVHQTTLRRWADKGLIPVMLTPGGHRRFDSAELTYFAQTKHRHASPLERSWAKHALETTRQEISDRPQPFTEVDEQFRSDYRLLGQRLMGLAMQYIASAENQPALFAEAKQIGRQYAQISQQAKLPLTTALQASLFFHQMLLETVLTLPETASVRPETNRRILRQINQLLNLIHLAITESYSS